MNGYSKITDNTLRPGQNGRHFPDDMFKCIFVNDNVLTFINITLKFVPKGPINNSPALVQIMAWCLPGDKPLSEPMLVYSRTYALLGLNELIACRSIGLYHPVNINIQWYYVIAWWNRVTSNIGYGVNGAEFPVENDWLKYLGIRLYIIWKLVLIQHLPYLSGRSSFAFISM